jgi:hypothetical protein
MSETIYLNAIRGKKSMYGTKLSINVESFIEELNNHKNEGGYCNIVIKDRKAPDKYGNNVYAVVDTWKPDPTKAKSNKAEATKSNTQVADDLDLPF